MLKIGDLAPDFTVKSHTGEEVRLSDLRGRTVVLWFYPKADTPGCTAEGCGFRDRNHEFSVKSVEVFGVSFDTIEENRAFAERFKFPFKLLCDTQREIGMAYGACDDPATPNARRITYVIGADGRIFQATAPADVHKHADELLTAIE